MINEMKEAKFDRARFEEGEMPARTRDGRKVLWVADSRLDIDYPIIAIIEPDGSAEYTRDGFLWENGEESSWDLVHEPKMRTLKIAVYRHGGTDAGGAYVVTSDTHHNFEFFVERANKEGRLLHLLEVEVPE